MESETDRLERIEVELRPIGVATSFTPEQWNMRIDIARKTVMKIIDEVFVEQPDKITPEIRALYDRYPLWGYYTHANLRVVRIYGFFAYADEGYGAWFATPNIGSISIGDCGVPVDDIQQVSCWTPEQMGLICMSGTPGVFIDPLGFMIPVRLDAIRLEREGQSAETSK